METDIQFTFRMPKSLKSSFAIACKNNGLPASLVLRKLMEQYIQDNRQLDIFKTNTDSKKRGKK